MTVHDRAALHGLPVRGQILQDLETPRLCHGAGDALHLLVGQARHACSIAPPIAPRGLVTRPNGSLGARAVADGAEGFPSAVGPSTWRAQGAAGPFPAPAVERA